MTHQQNREGRSSDLVISTPSHGDISIEFKWNVINDRLEVHSTTITTGDPTTPIEAVLLRRIPWAEIISGERRKLMGPTRIDSRQGRAMRGADKTQTLSDADLTQVAELYLQAWRENLPVQKYVADALKIAVSTAARRIGLARKRGFISRDINPPTNKERRTPK